MPITALPLFVSATFVRQRLRLAKVSPKLLETYERDGMTLDQLMAFTVTDDYPRQEQVWEALANSWSKEPYQIRRMLTETTVKAGDRRALFVDAYAAADNGGWLQDPALLDRLVGEKLRAAADEIAAEGWKWIVVDVDLPYGHIQGLRILAGTPIDLTEEERTQREAMRKEYDDLEAEYGEADELPDEVDRRLGEIEEAFDAFENRPAIYDPADIAIAGVFGSIARNGDLIVERGYVRPEDELPESVDGEGDGADADGVSADGEPSVHRTAITIGSPSVDADDEGDAIKPLPELLVIELTAHRTLALQDAVAGNPHVALPALLHKLVTDFFSHRYSGSCLEASVHHVNFPVRSGELNDSPTGQSIQARHDAWAKDLPSDENDRWIWLDGLDDESRLALLAHRVSYGVNALHERISPYGAGISQHGLEQRLREADQLARASGLDMVDAGWRPTVDNYLGRVTKTRILEAVREAAARRRRSSSTISRSPRWPRRPNGSLPTAAGCRSRCG